MTEMPYRRPCPPESPATRSDRDLWLVFAIVWIASAARIVAALFHHAAIDAESSVALLLVVVIPVALRKVQ